MYIIASSPGASDEDRRRAFAPKEGNHRTSERGAFRQRLRRIRPIADPLVFPARNTDWSEQAGIVGSARPAGAVGASKTLLSGGLGFSGGQRETRGVANE